MIKILVVDDDNHIRELIKVFLENSAYEVEGASNGQEALEKVYESKIDLAIVDVMMPKVNGLDLCKEIRKDYDFPILMLTAKGETQDIVKGFGAGVDDYMSKPFDLEELDVRIKALLKRYKINLSQSISVGELWMDKKNFEIKVNGEKIDIALKEFQLLYKLAENLGKTISRDVLIEEIWGYDFDGNERTLDVHINRLRDKFPKEKHSFKITTIRGLGYRMESN
ncbi:response regulator transcription factor [Clostridium mediterraneense]|uniref:response regulator transcription factor n=1 Tax=Clostridium mediterraneense TaxID=1805472 RepID=UPI00082F9FBF|nr:response regulator transcription factor [Clostridium mediterraneense]